MHNCDCLFSQTELTKFAPFCRYESGYVEKANAGLEEINVNCSTCKYFGKGYDPYFDSYEEAVIADKYSEEEVEEQFNHCHVIEGPICSTGFCRFWTQKEQTNDE